jgi:cell division protein FtsN
MATRGRRRTTRSSGRKSRKSRGLVWLIAGLALGAAFMYATQFFFYRDSKPYAGLNNLFHSARKAVEKIPEQVAKPAETDKPPKPRLDFYTILPGESVLPEPKADKKTAKVEAPEKGVSYILQAAAFTNSDDADHLKAKLVLNGLEPHIEKIVVPDKGIYYRVRLGPYSRVEDLDATNAKLGKLGIKALRIKVKKNAG